MELRISVFSHVSGMCQVYNQCLHCFAENLHTIDKIAPLQPILVCFNKNGLFPPGLGQQATLARVDATVLNSRCLLLVIVILVLLDKDAYVLAHELFLGAGPLAFYKINIQLMEGT